MDKQFIKFSIRGILTIIIMITIFIWITYSRRNGELDTGSFIISLLLWFDVFHRTMAEINNSYDIT